ncbi:MAG TPA: hypothetical protein VMB84_03605 [Stellaceae bacterium]|nr:hypothetical protein [Stellaceae bacterium]
MMRKIVLVTALSLMALTSTLSVGSADARCWWSGWGWHRHWVCGPGWGYRAGYWAPGYPYWGPGIRVGWGWGWHRYGWGWRRW